MTRLGLYRPRAIGETIGADDLIEVDESLLPVEGTLFVGQQITAQPPKTCVWTPVVAAMMWPEGGTQ